MVFLFLFLTFKYKAKTIKIGDKLVSITLFFMKMTLP